MFKLIPNLRYERLLKLRITLQCHPAEALNMVISEQLIKEAVLTVYAPFGHIIISEYIGTS